MSTTLPIDNKRIFGGTMLITGCCIGAGMIGLPVLSAVAGFLPSTLAMIFSYIFTTLTGLLILEATLWFEKRVNLPTIVASTLGKPGKYLTMGLFLFLFYCLFVAYIDGGGILMSSVLSAAFNTTLSRTLGMITCIALVAGITYAGTRTADYINRLLLIGLVITYFALIFAGMPYIAKENLSHVNFSASIAVVPILLICFGYQNLVPSITYYLKKNVNAIRFAIIIGNLIPFFIYMLWNFVILGMLPATHTSTAGEADTVIQLLQNALPEVSVISFVKAFSLFALLTSFIPSAISFVDFLKDAMVTTFHQTKRHDFLVYNLVFIPPFICALIYPHIFLRALSFAGGFIDVLLFGVLPATVVLIGRNVKKISGPYTVIGGNLTPCLILILSIAVLILKVGF